MKIDFDGLQAFALIAGLGGFSKAADHLHVTQTALTRRIQKLEAHLGARLLDRTTRSVQLTAVGQEFLPQAQRLVNDATLAVSQLRDRSRLARGAVTLASIPTVAHHALPDIIRRYAQQYPGTRIRIIDSASPEVRDAVLHGEAEFGIYIQVGRHAALAEHAILDEPFMFFCPEGHPLCGKKSIKWSDLKETELIMTGALSGNRALLDYQLARKGLHLSGLYEVRHLSTAIGMVAAGVGTAILPYSAMNEGESPRVRRIPIARPALRRTIALVRRKNATLSPAAQALYDMVGAAFAPHNRVPGRARRRPPVAAT